MNSMIRLSSREDMQAAHDRAVRTNAPSAPLFEAAAAGFVALAFAYHPECVLPPEMMAPNPRPFILTIGDDPPFDRVEAIGPSEWRVADRLRDWRPGGALIHAAGGDPQHHRMAVLAAVHLGRFLIVETAEPHAQAWCDRIAHLCPTTVLVPHPDAPPTRPETRH